MAEAKKPEVVAAIDLGSNSFHMVIARVIGEQLQVLTRHKEPVRLAAGIDSNGTLSESAQVRGLACLERFGQALRDIEPDVVRAVGTNTLRRARNGRAFLARANDALGRPVEVISGLEEARLIYLGVAHSVTADGGRRLVVDIGGGSTECIIGEWFDPVVADSLFMGCVTFSKRYFPGGNITEKRMRKAELGALQELSPILKTYRAYGWETAVGSSGTISAIQDVLRVNGWGAEGITQEGLDWLRDQLIDARKTARIQLEGLKEERREVIPGGLAILRGIFEGLRVQQMTAASGALREGVIYDVLGRIRHEDRRDQTIRGLSERYHIDPAQAGRVEKTAVSLLKQAAEHVSSLGSDEAERFLRWASRLHEIGLAVSYSGYHKHGAYLLLHSNMAGFSRDDQETLSALVRFHRRRLSRAELRPLGKRKEKLAFRLCVILRLAVLLHRSRRSRPLPKIRFEIDDKRLEIVFSGHWLEDNPLTRSDLETEADYLRKEGLELIAR